MIKSKVLITGITGMVGSHLADLLLKNTNWEIYGMCRWRSSLYNVSHLLYLANSGGRLNFLHGDLNDYISVMNVVEKVQPDYVFHLQPKVILKQVLYHHSIPLTRIFWVQKACWRHYVVVLVLIQ